MTTSDEYDDQDLTRIFESLRSPRRRIVLQHLRTENDPAEVPELAEAITKWETDGGERPQAKSTIEHDLQHRHLPKLADLGVIDYDERTRFVRYTGSALLDEWLEETEPIDRD